MMDHNGSPLHILDFKELLTSLSACEAEVFGHSF